jgi:hypothetical protein
MMPADEQRREWDAALARLEARREELSRLPSINPIWPALIGMIAGAALLLAGVVCGMHL